MSLSYSTINYKYIIHFIVSTFKILMRILCKFMINTLKTLCLRALSSLSTLGSLFINIYMA